MAKEFINPNWHVLVIHYPLGLFVLGMVIELLSFMYRRSTLRLAGRWMILLGALSAIPAALTGIYAFANVARMELPQGASAHQPWYEIAGQTNLNPEQWEHLGRHAFSQALATGVCAVLVTLALGCSDAWRRKLYFPILLGLLFGLTGMVYGAWHGGEMVYRHGTAVLRVEHKGATTDSTGAKSTDSAPDEQTQIKHGIEYFVPPLQLHVFLAGVAVAFALGALGLSMRAIATHGEVAAAPLERDEFGYERDPLLEPPRRVTADLDVARSLNPEADVDPTGRLRRPPVSRLWLLVFFIAAGAALAGVWVFAGPDVLHTWQPRNLWDRISPRQRLLWHTISGAAIIVVPLLLAGVMRVARRPRAVLALLSLVLLAAVAVQVWLGILLMFDTARGPVTRFNRRGDSTSPTSQPATAPSTAPSTQTVAAGQ